jgi:hypothetical protein
VLYRIDPDRTVTEWKTDIGISNMAWSPDKAVFYLLIDVANAIYAYDYDFRRELFEGASVSGRTEAMACRWLCNRFLKAASGTLGTVLGAFFAWPEMVRLKSNSGRQSNAPPPAPWRKDLKTLYITSAVSDERFAGGLFAGDVSVPGLPKTDSSVFRFVWTVGSRLMTYQRTSLTRLLSLFAIAEGHLTVEIDPPKVFGLKDGKYIDISVSPDRLAMTVIGGIAEWGCLALEV